MAGLYIIAYDVRDDRRRRKLANWLENHAQRIQYSVFERVLNTSQLEWITQQLAERIDPNEDRLVIYPLCAKCLKAELKISTNRPENERQSLSRQGYQII